MFYSKLPNDLEVHDNGDAYYDYHIRPIGCWFNWWRPSVGVDFVEERFTVWDEKSIPLAERLHKIYPEIPVITRYRSLVRS